MINDALFFIKNYLSDELKSRLHNTIDVELDSVNKEISSDNL